MTETINLNTCESCKYFRTNNVKPARENQISRGNCKRYPPMPVPDKANLGYTDYRNAVVRIDDWCGEFTSK
jgi:hypothetical protein